MPLSAPTITAAILAAGTDLRGPSWFRLAPVIGAAVYAWSQIPGNLVVSGVTVGVAGGGSVFGTLVVPPNPVPVEAAAAAAGLLGFAAPMLARAIGVGVATAFSTSGTYIGVSAGVGTGTDVSHIVSANGPALIAAITAAAGASGVLGVNVPRIASGLGTGIAVLLLTGSGVGVVTGPSGPSPAAGTSISRVF